MLHPYVIGEATAVASLDGLRALMALHEAEEFSAQPDPERVVFWGASEGGFAALWVDRYAPHYAPEFFPVGTIAAIPATDPLGLAEHAVVNYGPTSSAIAAALVTMQDWYGQGDLSTVFSEAPFNALEVLPELVATTCDDYSALSEVSQSSELYAESFIASIASGEFVDPWTCYLQEGVLRESVVPLASDTPTLMILAEEDDLAIPELVRSDMPVLCDQGYRIEHLECAGASHTAAAVQTLPYQLAWARDRMAGAPWNPTALCEITDPVDCEALQ